MIESISEETASVFIEGVYFLFLAAEQKNELSRSPFRCFCRFLIRSF